jgi:hypothetical protein
MDYQEKYLKYKEKYVSLKNQLHKQIGGVQKNIGVYIGRFQPLHNAHLMTIMKGLIEENHLIVLPGTHGKAEIFFSRGERDPKNPYTTDIRIAFIKESLRGIDPELLKKLSIIPIADSNHPSYKPEDSDQIRWYKNLSFLIIEDLKTKYGAESVSSIENIRKNFNIFLYGSGKDELTTRYLKTIIDGAKIYGESYLIPKLIEPQVKPGSAVTLDATEIRGIITQIKTNEAEKVALIEKLKSMVPEGVIRVLRDVEHF